MMNKKAIAAFAAGATLLAGFAMATPAMAETPASTNPVADATLISAMKATIEKDKADIEKARTWEAEVSSAYVAAKDKAAETDGSYKFATLKEDGHHLNSADTTVTADKADAEVTKLENAALKASDDIDAAVAKLAADEAYLAQLEGKTPTPDHTTPDHTTPVQPAKPGSKLEAVKNVLAKKVDVDAASHVFAEKKEAYTKAAATLTAAKGELDAAKHDAAVAQQALSDFDASGVNDSAARERLQGVLDRANAHVVRTQNAFDKALVDFNAAKTADLAAQAAYNLAKAAYDAAYNEAIKLGVNPDLLPSVTAIDPLSPAFPQLAQAQKIYADALAGKFGASAQKAVQKAEAVKPGQAGKAGANGSAAAGAKTEVENKNGKDKRGNTHTGTGVGVTLTALAATMLAGMGAAVRKARH
ncbi:hypothetical protein ACMZ79_04765 [Gardnerella vaginalis]|uniref:hypothetical protein n=1 Tax=Gardnerella vaginalis TaxID=2702 RepID=UPI0039EFE53B